MAATKTAVAVQASDISTGKSTFRNSRMASLPAVRGARRLPVSMVFIEIQQTKALPIENVLLQWRNSYDFAMLLPGKNLGLDGPRKNEPSAEYLMAKEDEILLARLLASFSFEE